MVNNQITPYRPLDLMLDKKMTNSDFTDFIGVWENFVPKPFCEKLIGYFNKTFDNYGSYIGAEINKDADDILSMKGEANYGGSLNRKDLSFLINYANEELTYQICQFLSSCAKHYIEEYAQLQRVSLISTDIKIQKTPPGGGYHVWHYENSLPEYSQRELTWMIYLNDLPDGEGETEFLYQRRRIKPTQGTVVIFPAGMTHVHKGNTVFTTDKYIITGWYIKTGT
jgi:hypothetical protein